FEAFNPSEIAHGFRSFKAEFSGGSAFSVPVRETINRDNDVFENVVEVVNLPARQWTRHEFWGYVEGSDVAALRGARRASLLYSDEKGKQQKLTVCDIAAA